MTEHRIAILAVKVFGLYVAFVGLSGLFHIIEFIATVGFDPQSIFVSGLGSSIVILALGGIVLVRAEQFAGFALGVDGETGAVVDSQPSLARADAISPHAVLAVAITILGVYFLSQVVVHGFSALGLSMLDPVAPATGTGDVVVTSPRNDEAIRTELFKAGGYLLAGLPLVFGARRFARRLNLNERHNSGSDAEVQEPSVGEAGQASPPSF